MTLEALRRRIDRVDVQLLRLLNTRARLGLQVGALKKQHGTRVFDPQRERAILQRLTRANHGPLSSRAIHAIYRQILQQVRRLEKSA